MIKIIKVLTLEKCTLCENKTYRKCYDVPRCIICESKNQEEKISVQQKPIEVSQ